MRKCGILMPISSLPSPYGIGTIGKEAYNFIDFLSKSGQYYWQVLPIGPTGYGDSPYQSFSAFAFNPYFIDLDDLIEEGLICKDDIDDINWGEDISRVDYYALYKNRASVLKKACENISDSDEKYCIFARENAFFLDDYALFMALKDENDGKALSKWDEEYKVYENANLEKLREKFKDKISYYKKVQYLFFYQWQRLKEYANRKNVHIIGDMPIYVSSDSSDVWANEELFQVDEEHNLKAVAGCPPDYFSPEGQLWGNPLYDWEYHKKTGFDWWIKRLDFASKMFDVVRIDHFRGFAGYYSIPSSSNSAKVGEWMDGPSKDFINAIRSKLPNINIIAEDLGFLTDDVIDLLNYSEYPGMKVLQFAFTPYNNSAYLPHNIDKNSVCYTGTHDNPTLREYIEEKASEEEIAFAKKYLNESNTEDLLEAIIKVALMSVSDTVIIPIQDYLKVGSNGRMNTPSVIGKGNWTYRIKKEDLTDELSEKILDLARIYARC